MEEAGKTGLTPKQEKKIKELAEQGCRHQMEEAAKAGLSDKESMSVVALLIEFTVISHEASCSVPEHLRNLTLQFFLNQQEVIWEAQQRHKTISASNMMELCRIAKAEMQRQKDRLAQEKVLDHEKRLISLALYKLSMWMVTAMARLPPHFIPLFNKLAIDQFKELMMVYAMGEN